MSTLLRRPSMKDVLLLDNRHCIANRQLVTHDYSVMMKLSPQTYATSYCVHLPSCTDVASLQGTPKGNLPLLG